MSFVLRREATLSGEGGAPESPKLWRGATASEPSKPATPPKSPPRTKEDLFRFYENMQSAGQDLSLKDLVERTKKHTAKGPLRTLRETEDREEGGGGNHNQQFHRYETPPAKPKVAVPRKANGERIHGQRKKTSTPFGDFLENVRKSNAAESFHEALSRDHDLLASPRRSISSSAASPRRSVSSSKMPPPSPSRTPRPCFEELPPNLRPSPNNHIPARSPLRSPGLPSSLVSPNLQFSPLALASYPSPHRPLFGEAGDTGRRRETLNESWVPPPSPPRRSTVGASPLGEAPRSSTGDRDPGPKKLFADVFKTKPATAAPPFQNVHPSKHCSACSSYAFFKTRCLVCGNIYCTSCTKDAMGHMPEGRKCLKTCLGKPIHSRYIREAGNGCFCFVPSVTNASEMRWARQRIPHDSVTSTKTTRRTSAHSSASATNLQPVRRSAHSHLTPHRMGVPT